MDCLTVYVYMYVSNSKRKCEKAEDADREAVRRGSTTTLMALAMLFLYL